MKKSLLFIVLCSAFLKAEFPSFDEVFNKTKKEKVKIVYVKEKEPTKVIEKHYYNYPVDNRKQRTRIHKSSKKYNYPKRPENYKRYYKKESLKEHARRIDTGQVRRAAKSVDFRTGKTELNSRANSVNPSSFSKKVKNSRTVDAVDRLHMMAECEAKAKTTAEKERCWMSESQKKKQRQTNKVTVTKKKSQKDYVKESQLKHQENEVMKTYNKLYKGNPYYQNPM